MSVLLAVTVTILSSSPAQADLGDQLAKLLAEDGAAFDRFGTSVAIIGAIAIVGAEGDFDNGFASGSAYLFGISDPANPTQIAKLLPNDGAAHDGFGHCVAISGATAVVGAWRDDDNGENSGSAYLFDTSTGRLIAKFLPNDGAAFDEFGISVAMSPNGIWAIVGAWGDDDNGSHSGSAYLFNTTSGRQIAKLLPNDGAAFDNFGFGVAIYGATAIVGANRDQDNGESSGSAYLFDITTGRQIAKLLPNDGAAFDEFGRSVAISGAAALVGAPFDDDCFGSAYLFDTTTGRQNAKLLANDGAADNKFGFCVAISGAPGKEIAIVGTLVDDNGDNSGSAYLFDTTTGRQIAKLLAIDGMAGDAFGNSVAISSATAIVGAWRDDDNGADSGSAYLFEVSSCPWDLDNSGSVGTSDLLALFAQWGTDGPADFDGSGAVGTADLLILFANWGPCV